MAVAECSCESHSPDWTLSLELRLARAGGRGVESNSGSPCTNSASPSRAPSPSGKLCNNQFNSPFPSLDPAATW